MLQPSPNSPSPDAFGYVYGEMMLNFPSPAPAQRAMGVSLFEEPAMIVLSTRPALDDDLDAQHDEPGKGKKKVRIVERSHSHGEYEIFDLLRYWLAHC